MAQVPEKVLAWLYNVLNVCTCESFQLNKPRLMIVQEYHDPQRIYSDAARTLSAYPSISPRTEVYTYENGGSALLLTLSGTLPVAFRGQTYRFPVKLWIPQAYPQEPPIAYVTPGRELLVRPGQHVGVDGRVYHPYLRGWSRRWDKASIAEFLEFLQQVFAKEPPVISKAQQQQYHQRPIGQSPLQSVPGASSMAPQPPPKPRVGSVVQPVEMPSTSTPPPRPPKPGDEYVEPLPPRTSSRNVALDGPPLPPLPHERAQNLQYAPPQYQNGYAASPRPLSQIQPPPPPGYQNGRPPGPSLPPLSQQQPNPQQYQNRSNHDRSPVSPVSPVSGYSELAETNHPRAPTMPLQQHHLYQQQPPPRIPQYALQQGQYRPPFQQPQTPLQQYAPNQYYPQQAPRQQAKKEPPPDLLSDPFDVALPGPSQSGPPAPAPPIPPNPEKEHLLQALSASLVQQAQVKVSQNLSALAPLQAQQQALRAAHQRLEAEVRQLEALSGTLDSNEAILRRSIQDCDSTIRQARQKKQPPIDEVLIAPTMVANQLWTLCAEEASCREAMYVLQKAVDRGRVGGADFVRQMRALGREAFGKMVLARKCARGLGLEMSRR